MSWWPWRRHPNGQENRGAAAARVATEAKLAAARKLTPLMEQMATSVASLPPDEFVDRVARAFRRS